MNPEYLSFAQLIIEQKKVSDSINITPTKFHGQSLTASNLKSIVQSLQNFVSRPGLFVSQADTKYSLNWQKLMHEIVAMVKQLGIPTWFMTLSPAYLGTPELYQIVCRT